MDAHSRIIEIAQALLDSGGQDAAGASTGELIAAALVAGHPEWAGYTRDDGRVDIFAAIDRLGPEWFELCRELFEDTSINPGNLGE